MREGRPPAYVYKDGIFCPACIRQMFRPRGVTDVTYHDLDVEQVLGMAARLRIPQIDRMADDLDPDDFPVPEYFLEHHEQCTRCWGEL